MDAFRSTAGPAYAWSAWRNVVVNVWSRGGTASEVRELFQHIDATAEANGGTAAVLMIIPERCSLPSMEARKIAGDYIRVPGRVSHVAIVVEGDGFWASAMRSVFSLIGLVARPQAPWKMVRSVEEALAWQAAFVPEGDATEDALRAMIEDLRGRLTTPPM